MINTNYNCNNPPNVDFSNVSEINEIDNRIISHIKKLPELELKQLIAKLRFGDWRKILIDLLQVNNGQKPTLSENTLIEILKLFIVKHPSCTSLIKSASISQEARIEIALWYAEKNPDLFFVNIDHFGIDTEAGLIEICKLMTTKASACLMIELPTLDINDQKGLLEILWLAAQQRPDLVLKSIHELGIESQTEEDNLILKCINQIPSMALNSKKISAWIDEHQELVSGDPLLEKIVKASKVAPSPEMEKIFDFFKEIAEPSVSPIELAGRALWLNYSLYKNVKEKDIEYQEKCHLYEKLKRPDKLRKMARRTQCSMTSHALQYAIFGEDSCHRIDLEKASYRKEELDKVWATIKKNEEGFNDRSLSFFFGYFFQCTSIDHCFLIIQYRDAQKQIKYRILQSWVNDHSLHDYMKKRRHDLSSEEFVQFADGLNHVLFYKHCSNQKEIFFKNYFMTETTRSYYSQKSEMTVEWNFSNRSFITKNSEKFERVKQSLWGPKK